VSIVKQRRGLKVFARMIRSLWGERGGSALVEATVVVPVLFTLTFGVYEFSWVFYNQQLVSAGIRDAARYAAKWSNPCDATVVASAQNIATTGQTASGGTARVTGRNSWTWGAATVNVACASVDNTSGSYRGGNTITIVTVSTSFTDSSFGMFPYLGLTPPTIAVSHSERAIQDTPAF
jgi:Flp pilus assembly protein TadG